MRGLGMLAAALTVSVAAVSTGAPSARAQGSAVATEAAVEFKTLCAPCHTIGGGPLVGPDLMGVTDRRDREWLVRFVLDPKAVIDSGDPVAAEMLAAANGIIMPTQPGMTRKRASALVDFLAGGGAGAPPAPPTDLPPLTAEDAARGKALYSGAQPLQNGGPTCTSCHATSADAAPGGGRLGPDLTEAYVRLGGHRGLAAWLSAPPTPTMQPVFRDHPMEPGEVTALIAHLEALAEGGGGPASPRRSLTVVAGAAGGALVIFLVLGTAWRGRFRAVRRPLVQGAAR